MRRNQSDVAMRSLLSEIDNLDAKKKRLGIAQGCQYAREMAEYYEVFDTMKRDMLKQSLIIASITEQQCEAHLQLMRDHRRAEEQFQSTQPPVNQNTEWATVATEAIRTIGELGKTLLTTQATQQIVKQRAAAAMEPRADEARRATDDEKTAKLATVEQTSITVATVQAIDVPASPAHAAAIGPIAVLDVLTAKLDRLFGGAGGQPPASKPVAEQAARATVTDTATIAATASITPCITPSATLEVTPNVTPNLAPNVTPNREQFETRKDTSVEGSSLAMTDDRPFANAMEAPSEERAAVTPTAMMAEAIVTPNVTTSVTPSVTPTFDQNEREADGGNEGQPSSKASESPASTAAPAMRQASEPQTETAQPDARKSAALTLSQNPYVKSWRSIKSFVRRMTDMDLIVFTSSIPMFRSFLAMLRALTPYYQGPSMSLDELTELAAPS